MVNIEDVRRKLLKQGIDIHPQTLRLHSKQGGVNEIFTVESNKGPLLLHVGKHHAREIQYQKAKRIFYLSQFLSQHPKIPTSDVLDFGKDTEGNVYTVETFIEGEIYEEKKGRISHLEHLAQIIAELHQIEMEGAGYISYKNKQIDTTHTDWYMFLLYSSYKSLKEIHHANYISKEEYLTVTSKVKLFFNKYRKYIEGINGKLMHGDLTVGNVLMGKEEITAIIDLEFSLVGDPAWEFATHKYLQGTLLEQYFLELRSLGAAVNEDNFRFRIAIYDVIKQLLIANSLKKTDHFRQCWQTFKQMLDRMI